VTRRTANERRDGKRLGKEGKGKRERERLRKKRDLERGGKKGGKHAETLRSCQGKVYGEGRASVSVTQNKNKKLRYRGEHSASSDFGTNLKFMRRDGYPTEVGAVFTTVSSIRVSRVSVMVSVRDSVK